jgi:hypothetical protein
MECIMASSTDFSNIPGMTKEMRESVVAAFNAMLNWRDEIETANERCLGKVLDQTSAVAQSMGWPDQTIKTTRQFLEKTSKTQVQMIDQIMDGWKQQLKIIERAKGHPEQLAGQMRGHSPSMFPVAMPEFNPVAPWTFWLQVAEMWQRTWMPEAPSRADFRSRSD